MWLSILDFLHQAGTLALEMQSSAQTGSHLKDEHISSVVTQTDLRISQMFAAFVAKNFAKENYIIIDEESISKVEGNLFERMQQAEYQLVIDPIDGTLVYVNGMQTWGILIGIFKNLEPIGGFIYLPATQELAYCLNNKAFYVRHAFQQNEIKTQLTPKTDKTPFIYLLHHFQYDVDYMGNFGKISTFDFYSQAANHLYVLTRNVRANICHCHLWDTAAAMAFVKPLGFVFKNYQTEQNIESLNPSWLNDELSLTCDVVLSKAEDFAELKKIVTPKKGAL